MRVLVVKMSSMGDIIHALPALSDAMDAIPGVRFDWVVEEAFSEIPRWHPAVETVIPIALRRWRKALRRTVTGGEWSRYREHLRSRRYDAVIDAQGLLKSAFWVARLARGPVFGLDWQSAREPLASRFYDRRVKVAKGQHAVERQRQLFAQALGYPFPAGRGNYRIPPPGLRCEPASDSLVFLHGTARPQKQWPEEHWRELVMLATGAGWHVKLPWGNAEEHARARRLATASDRAEVLPRLGFGELAQVLSGASGLVSVDTGLSHLAAALDRPNVTLFGPTDPKLVGGYGLRQVSLRAADFPQSKSDPAQPMSGLTPAIVWRQLQLALQHA